MRGDLADDPITGAVAGGLVDQFEMVEIEIQQGVATDAQSGGAQPVRQLGFEFTPVRQIGQLVMTGLMAELLRQQTRVREIAQDADATDTPALTGAQSSEERRGGKECVGTFRTRWWPTQ